MGQAILLGGEIVCNPGKFHAPGGISRDSTFSSDCLFGDGVIIRLQIIRVSHAFDVWFDLFILK